MTAIENFQFVLTVVFVSSYIWAMFTSPKRLSLSNFMLWLSLATVAWTDWLDNWSGRECSMERCRQSIRGTSFRSVGTSRGEWFVSCSGRYSNWQDAGLGAPISIRRDSWIVKFSCFCRKCNTGLSAGLQSRLYLDFIYVTVQLLIGVCLLWTVISSATSNSSHVCSIILRFFFIKPLLFMTHICSNEIYISSTIAIKYAYILHGYMKQLNSFSSCVIPLNLMRYL